MSNPAPFCGPEGFGPFADPATRIDFTPCFEEMAILLLPKLLMLLCGPFRIWDVKSKPKMTSSSLSIVHLSKQVLAWALAACHVAELVMSLSISPRAQGYLLLSPFLSLLSALVAAALVTIEDPRVKRTSPILLIYWTGLLIGGIFKIRTSVLTASTSDPVKILFFVEFGLLALLWSLGLVPFPRRDYHPIGQEGTPSPELTTNFFSVLTFWWVSPLMALGFKKPLVHGDLWDLDANDKAEAIGRAFEVAWGHEATKASPSLLRALMAAFGAPFLHAAFFKIGQMFFLFVQPLLLEKLLDFINSFCFGCETQMPAYYGYLNAVGLFVAAIFQTVFLQQYYHRCMTTGMRLRTALVGAVYKKSFSLSNDSRQLSTSGEMVNLMSTDAQRLMDVCIEIHSLWSAPLQISIAVWLLYGVLGPAVFVGMLTVVILIPITLWITSKMDEAQQVQMKAKDHRIKLIDEILNGIKVIKFYAWEQSFLSKVQTTRNEELAALKRMYWATSFQSFGWFAAPFIMSATSFVFYVIIEEAPLNSDVAFVSLSLLNLMRLPMYYLPEVIIGAVQATVALNRLRDFLLLKELQPNNVDRSGSGTSEKSDFTPKKEVSVNNEGAFWGDDIVVSVSKGSFQWSATSGEVILDGINFEVKKEELVAVVGSVGSGKSSLISALLGDMEKTAGWVRVHGSVAYVAQQAWIMNASLQENILFGLPLEEAFYNRVVEACALLPDIQMLPAGDQTEIGERGINLSGGQKQRVSIARAVYSRSDVYLLDDPLSAVDAHVAKQLFDEVIGPKGLLKNASRILVTHSIQLLPRCDQILVLKSGRISEIGSFDFLKGRRGEFSQLIDDFAAGLSIREESANHPEMPEALAEGQEGEEEGGDYDYDEEEDEESNALDARGKIIEKEHMYVGQVEASVYKSYYQAMGFGSVGFLFLLHVLGASTSVGTNIWLSIWSSENSNDQIYLYVGVYTALGLAFSFITGLQGVVCYVVCGIQAATSTHEGMLHNIFRAPMSFFDTTPLGRIVNRFSKDQNTVDEGLIWTFRYYVGNMFDLLAVVFIVTYSIFYVAVALVPLGFLYYLVQRYFSPTSRQLKRLDSVSRSPIYSHFSETLNGAPTIRGYCQQARFVKENEHRINANLKAYYPGSTTDRWLGTTTEFIGSTIILFVGIFAVLSFESIDSATVGLAVTYALSVTQTLSWYIEDACDLETNIVSVERIREYSRVKTEAAEIVETARPPPAWPTSGEVVFRGYSTRYREGLDLVLREINCEIRPKEKIGVVGRTGAGKSSLTLALFRMIEPAAGSIVVDGIDIATLGLRDLRSHITIIPQDPVLFSGNLRNNLDPFKEYRDDEIWAALESSHLKDFVTYLGRGLEVPVLQGGANLSVGQRQLVCLARALLRKTKILVLDEATAAVDVETDDLLQKTIRSEFRECTIITIAHRINTILDSDRIMVLDQGRIVEFDTPGVLLENPDSQFRGMAHLSGLV